MAKRKGKTRKDLARKPATRKVADRVLIVTEGEKTEPDYLKRLIQELGLTSAQVHIVGDGGSEPITIFQDAEKILKRDDDFEQIYLVFDRDTHPTYDQALAAVRGLSSRRQFAQKAILAITSVPCFEVWLLLHASDSAAPFPDANSVVQQLKTQPPFGTYAKGRCDDYFTAISANRAQAIVRAERRIHEAQHNGEREHNENPSTRMHILVRALEEVARIKRGEA